MVVGGLFFILSLFRPPSGQLKSAYLSFGYYVCLLSLDLAWKRPFFSLLIGLEIGLHFVFAKQKSRTRSRDLYDDLYSAARLSVVWDP